MAGSCPLTSWDHKLCCPGSFLKGGQLCPSSRACDRLSPTPTGWQVLQWPVGDTRRTLTLPHCFAEEGLLYRARYFGDTDMYHKAQRMGTPSCSRLSEVQASLHG